MFFARPITVRPSRVLFVILFGMAVAVPATAHASGYSVRASVPYATPTAPSVFAAGSDGTMTTNATATLTGSCQVANPSFIITVWRAGTAIGSAPCLSRTFNIQVNLALGANYLTARTSNLFSLYGPDSSPITITLRLPVVPAPVPAVTSPAAATPAQQIAASDAGAASDLQAVTTQPFSPLATDKTASVGVTVSGGKSPYVITLTWGDGTTETHSVEQVGVYTYTHVYQKQVSYQVHGDVHDVLGASTSFDYAVVSTSATPQNSPGTSIGTTTASTTATASRSTVVKPAAAVVTGGAVITGLGYWLGAHHVVFQHRPTRFKTRGPTRGKTRR